MPISTEDSMEEVIRVAMRMRTAKILDEEAKKAAETVVKRMQDELDRIVLEVSKHYSIQRGHGEVIITVKKVSP